MTDFECISHSVTMTEIEISRISLSGWNPRKAFDQEAFAELKASILRYGILEPVVVRPSSVNDDYELVAGERRFRAAAELNLATIPAVVRELTDRQVKEIMLIENLQRSQLEPLEEASALEVLLQDGTTQETVGKKIGKSQAWIANRLRLLQAPDNLKELLISREITPKHALLLLPYKKYPVLDDILTKLKNTLREKENISVKTLESLIVDVISGYGNENVFNLDDISYDFSELEQYLQLDNCDNCSDITFVKTWGDEEERYCLNRRCWKDKVNIAKQKYEKAREATRNELAADGKDVVDTTKLNWDQFAHLSSNHLDMSGCGGCEFRRLDASNNEICLDKACLKKKETAFTKAKNKAARQEEQRVYEALDLWLDQKKSLDFADLRQILLLISNWSWTDSIKKGLSRWGVAKNDDTRRNVIETIPDEELHIAIHRLVIVHTLSALYGPVDMKKLETILPGVDLTAFSEV